MTAALRAMVRARLAVLIEPWAATPTRPWPRARFRSPAALRPRGPFRLSAGLRSRAPQTSPAIAQQASALDRWGCVACPHRVGRSRSRQRRPPLDDWSRRGFIAGALPNTRANLVAWLLDPQAIEPGTTMPDVGLPEQDARNIAAYLFALR